MELLYYTLPISLICVFYIYSQFKPYENMGYSNEIKTFHFPIAISAMKEKDLVRIILNRDESSKRVKKAMSRLKTVNKDLYNKVKSRIS